MSTEHLENEGKKTLYIQSQDGLIMEGVIAHFESSAFMAMSYIGLLL